MLTVDVIDGLSDDFDRVAVVFLFISKPNTRRSKTKAAKTKMLTIHIKIKTRYVILSTPQTKKIIAFLEQFGVTETIAKVVAGTLFYPKIWSGDGDMPQTIPAQTFSE